MTKTIAESGKWTLKCRCGEDNPINGELILKLPAIQCRACECYPNIVSLKVAVGLLINFYKEIGEATRETDKYDTWAEITPPCP